MAGTTDGRNELVTPDLHGTTASQPDAASSSGQRGGTGTGRRLGIAERRFALRGADLAAVSAAWWLALSSEGLLLRSTGVGAVSLAVLGFLWMLAAEGAQAYSLRPGHPREDGSRPAGRSGTVPVFLPGPALVAGGLALFLDAVLAAAGFGSLLAMPGWPHALGLLAGLVLVPGVLRLVLRSVMARPGLRPRVLVAGPEAEPTAAVDLLRGHSEGVYHVVGATESADELGRRIEAGGVDMVALTRPGAIGDQLARHVDRCVELGIEVVGLAALLERLTGRVPLDLVQNDADLLPLSPPAVRLPHRAARRFLDLALVAVGGVLFLPILPMIAAAIRLETPGPVFYSQERVGKGGRTFRVYKLRSMVADAEAPGVPRWATEDDPRITRVGRFLRATHLDEFPQMLNILKGEMSPVGPRPERPEFIDELTDEIPHYRMRHAVRPGMAGWALVEHGYASSTEEARRKHEYDLYYVKHQSVWLDLVVLARTLVDTFTLGGR